MYNPKEVELRIKDFWEKENLLEKTIKHRSGKKKFYFLDGPPYATGEIHIGTAMNKILKDFYLRFFRMLGYDVWSQPGYDTHGLPIENQVEKMLGIKNKKEIEKYGIANFIEECRKFSVKYIDVMSKQFLDLGVWMDWKNPYLTLTNQYIEGAWHTFKVAYEKNLLFEGSYPVHVCPRCETAVAYNEIEYEKITEDSIYVKFPVMGKENEFLVIFTTTPWTLPANTGIMVHPKFEYAKVKVGKETLIIAKKLVKEVMEKLKIKDYKIIETLLGKDLVKFTYSHPLKDYIPFQSEDVGNIGKVVLSEQFVNLEEGTGLVHTAPGHGKEDYKVGKENGLSIFSPLKLDGTFTEDVKFLEGIFAKDADKIIIEKLKEKSALLGTEKITHDYPMCWRCNTPLLLMSVPQWFFKVSELRNKLLKENKRINWIPKWAGKRFDNWLESLDDWPISRQRYWGIPLPIWTCDYCKNVKVFESAEELPVEKKPKDLHRPYIDDVTWACKECGKGIMKRISDVLDVWFDSGVAAWASLGYPKNKALFEEMWPVKFVLEGPDQIRGWWNSSMITSIITFDERPFENILYHGFVLDAKGIKMAKSLGNVVSPQQVIEKYGRDILRFYMLKTDSSMDFHFNWEELKEVMKFFTIFYNSMKFFETYCKPEKLENLKVEDKWIISKLNNLIGNCINYKSKYFGYKALELIEKFVIEDLSHWYIKIIRERTWPTYEGKDKKAAFATLYYVLDKLNKMLAPVIPFLTEDFYQKLFKIKESVHLEDYPQPDKRLIDNKLEKEMEVVKKIVEIVSSIRHEKKIKHRYILENLYVYGKDTDTVVKNFENIIKLMTNVKNVLIKDVNGMKKVDSIKVYLETKVPMELKTEWLIRELIRAVQDKRKDLKLKVHDKIKLYLPDKKEFKSWEKIIKEDTGSQIVWGEIAGHKAEFEFENKKYKFGIEI